MYTRYLCWFVCIIEICNFPLLCYSLQISSFWFSFLSIWKSIEATATSSTSPSFRCVDVRGTSYVVMISQSYLLICCLRRGKGHICPIVEVGLNWPFLSNLIPCSCIQTVAECTILLLSSQGVLDWYVLHWPLSSALTFTTLQVKTVLPNLLISCGLGSIINWLMSF